MIALLLVSLLAPGALGQERTIRIKDYILPGSAMLATGFLDGTVETLSHHYDNGFKRRFPEAKDVYWDPDESWRNKYRDGDPALGPKFPGSTTAFVFTTDGYHMLRTSKRAIETVTLVYCINDHRSRKKLPIKKRVLKVVADAIILTTIRNIGFHASYSLLFKPQR